MSSIQEALVHLFLLSIHTARNPLTLVYCNDVCLTCLGANDLRNKFLNLRHQEFVTPLHTHTNTQTDRQTDRQTHTHTHTHTHTNMFTLNYKIYKKDFR